MRAGALACAVSALLAFGAPGASAKVAVMLQLDATGPTTIAQGDALRYRATVTNHGPADEDVVLTLRLIPPPGETPVVFFEWAGELPLGARKVLTGTVTPTQWFARTGTYRIDSAVPTTPLSFSVSRARIVVPRFEDVTTQSGLATKHEATIACDNWAAGAAWGDIEGDGDLDLYLPHQDRPAQLFVNRSGRFTDEAASRGAGNPKRVGIGAVFVDVNNDGDQDLYVLNDGPNRLYENDGRGRFKDVAKIAGLADAGLSTSAAWADVDEDGHLDVFVTNYGRCVNDEKGEIGADGLYRARGDGTFQNVSSWLTSFGKANDGLGFQAAWLDHDRDGDLDLYVANDKIRKTDRANILWRNDGKAGGRVRFTDISESSGASLGINAMGIGLGDYDRDGDTDMAVSNMLASALLRNDGDGTFRNVAKEAGTARPMQQVDRMAITWGLGFHDLNLDGWLDLHVAAGDMAFEIPRGGLPPPPAPDAPIESAMAGGMEALMLGPQTDHVFVGSNGRFLDVSALTGAVDPGRGRGVAYADVDRDGRMDLYVVNQDETPRLLRNVTPMRGAHWLEVQATGTVSNRDACGARLEARLPGGATLVRDVTCGSSSLSSGSDKVVHFGLGAATTIEQLTISWPSGAEQTLRDVRVDQVLEVTEPGTREAALVAPDIRPGTSFATIAILLAAAALVIALARVVERSGAGGVTPVRRWALVVLLVAVVVQVLHQLEHVAQVAQAKAFHSEQASGLLGRVFDTEWVHVVYNIALFAALALAFGAFGAASRARLRERSPWGYRTMIAAVAIQGYHVVEHLVKIYQHVVHAQTPAPGILGTRFDLVWLHFTINIVVLALAGAATAAVLGRGRARPVHPTTAPAEA